jgi:hypothetical protein
MVVSVLELCKCYIKLDQPNTALDIYSSYATRHPGDLHALIGAGNSPGPPSSLPHVASWAVELWSIRHSAVCSPDPRPVERDQGLGGALQGGAAL